MNRTTESKDLKLMDILELVYKGDLQLPEFQRSYVWKDSNIKALFDSVLLGHPIGSVLLLELNKEKPMLAWVNFSDISVPKEKALEYKGDDKSPPKYLVLDGQQRLTSLAHLIKGESEKNWYIDLQEIKKDWEENGSPETGEKLREWIDGDIEIVKTISKHKKPKGPNSNIWRKQWQMPMTLLESKVSFRREITKVRDGLSKAVNKNEYDLNNYSKIKPNKSKQEIQEEIKENNGWLNFLNAPISELFDNYFDYTLPSVVVPETMSISGVCKVFIKMNTSGIELGAFDLVVAVMFPQGIKIKQMFDDILDKYPLIKILDANSKRYLLQTIALMVKVSPKTAGLPKVLTAEHINKNWDKAAKLLEEACQQIDDNCGASLAQGSDRYLVYSPLVASLACILKEHPINHRDANLARLRKQKLKAWYFGAGVADRYSDGTDNKQIQDIEEMEKWFGSATFDGETPKWLKQLWSDFSVGPNASLGKAIISMINLKEPKDFFEDKPVGPKSDKPCDLHHIFPRAALRDIIMRERGIRDKEKAEVIISKELMVDSVLNQTWIFSDTNRKVIGDSKPSVYLKTIQDEYGKGPAARKKLASIMDGHCINDKALNALLEDNYSVFIEERKKAFIEEFKTTGFVKNIIENQETEDDD